MKILELFCGTKYVGKIFGDVHGHHIVSVDFDKKRSPDICCDILDLDYTELWKPGDFDFIWASPPCATFSTLRSSHIGRVGKDGVIKTTKETIISDMENVGVPIMKKAQEIIEYLKPKYWVMENPKTGRMKNYIDKDVPFYDVDYCAYGYRYQKQTRLWSNIVGFKPLVCDKLHIHESFGGRSKSGVFYKPTTLSERYSIPPLLIESIYNCILE